MILYHKNLRNLEELKAEKQLLKDRIAKEGWASPFLQEKVNRDPVTEEKANQEVKSKANFINQARDTAINFLSGNNLISAASSVLLQPAAIRLLGNFLSKKTGLGSTLSTNSVISSAASLATSKGMRKVAVEVLGGYAKWKAIELTISTVGRFIKQRKQNKRTATVQHKQLKHQYNQLVKLVRAKKEKLLKKQSKA